VNNDFIFRPDVTFIPSYKTFCGICHDELVDKKQCEKQVCIEEKELIRQESTIPKCWHHQCYFSECLENPDCEVAQNLKRICKPKD